MRKPTLVVMTALLVLTLATMAMAADPILGSWKLNISQSKISPGLQSTWNWAAAKGRVDIYREAEDGMIEFTEKRTLMDGSPFAGNGTFPKQGGTLKPQQPPLTFVETIIDPGNWYVTCLQNGKQVELIHKTISKDGKTMRMTVKGIDPMGKLYDGLLIYERQ